MSILDCHKQKTGANEIVTHTYDINVPKHMIHPADIDKFYGEFISLLVNLPPIMKRFYGSFVNTILLQDKENKYRIVWLGLKIRDIFRGKPYLPLLADSWEDEYQLYTCSEPLAI